MFASGLIHDGTLTRNQLGLCVNLESYSVAYPNQVRRENCDFEMYGLMLPTNSLFFVKFTAGKEVLGVSRN